MGGETIAAIATPLGQGGIGIIRISGEKAFKIAQTIFKAKNGSSICQMQAYTAAYGHIYENGKPIDECIALVFKGPRSYTGENVVELSCHGGIYILKRVLRAALKAGARLAQPGEFTKRAFLSGKLDLTSAEAVMDMIGAQGKMASEAAFAQHEGALFKGLQEIKDVLYDILSDISAFVDFPEEDHPSLEPEGMKIRLNNLVDKMDGYISTFDKGKVFREGINTVIAGKPNVGKSTIMNLLSGMEKSIVTEIPGTTRDVVEEDVLLGELRLRISDTAGLREAQNPVERAGVARARERIKNAQIVLAVFDASQPLSGDDHELISELTGKNVVAVLNKMDKPVEIDTDFIKRKFDHIIKISAASGEGLPELENVVSQIIKIGRIETGNGIIANERQLSCMIEARSAVQSSIDALDDGITIDAVSVGIEQAADALAELTGEKASESVIDLVFSKFCVGK